MSKIGGKPIIYPEKVALVQEGQKITVKGPLGEMVLCLPDNLKAEIAPGVVKITRQNEEKKTKSVHGTYARLLANAITGTTTGFFKTLEVVGTGYRPLMEGETLVLSLGFSHPVRYLAPAGIKIEVQENKVKVSGVNKEKVGEVADKIKRFRRPDAYKGKGIRYLGEKLKLKPGKAVAKAGVTAEGK